ncbi:uncharacterized protein Bfra_006354 [Botrytis fragariae]|uniref:Uncharacterized protein n=1 Tax=Botrytis fragariae TaxID=1964551 RepID=A0A8H6EP72_9HELO|nr:uncharacterized protein Bfra_006354 [Botrytis fragariae]KAF5879150.1 hypothetical protein Bfra_006354 [Botrytis fragariae]
MPPQPIEHKFKIIMAAMSQFSSNEKDILPVPNYTILAEQLGLPSYASAQGVWKRLTDELKEGAKGDLKIRDPEADKKKKIAVQQHKEESPVKKRAAEESDTMANDIWTYTDLHGQLKNYLILDVHLLSSISFSSPHPSIPYFSSNSTTITSDHKSSNQISTNHLNMSASPSVDDLKMLIAVLVQCAPENKPLPTPDHLRLAEALGLRDRIVSKNKWSTLMRKFRDGDFGDMGGLIASKEPNEAATRKRPVVEVPVEGYMDKPPPSPTKKVKGVQKVGKAKGNQKKAVKDEI